MLSFCCKKSSSPTLARYIIGLAVSRCNVLMNSISGLVQSTFRTSDPSASICAAFSAVSYTMINIQWHRSDIPRQLPSMSTKFFFNLSDAPPFIDLLRSAITFSNVSSSLRRNSSWMISKSRAGSTTSSTC